MDRTVLNPCRSRGSPPPLRFDACSFAHGEAELRPGPGPGPNSGMQMEMVCREHLPIKVFGITIELLDNIKNAIFG